MVKSQLIYLLEKIHVIYHMDVVQDGRLQDTPPPTPLHNVSVGVREFLGMKLQSQSLVLINRPVIHDKGGSRGGDRGSGNPPPPPPWNFGKKVVITFVIGTGLILHSIYVNYSHKSKKGSKCGDLMVRT